MLLTAESPQGACCFAIMDQIAKGFADHNRHVFQRITDYPGLRKKPLYMDFAFIYIAGTFGDPQTRTQPTP